MADVLEYDLDVFVAHVTSLEEIEAARRLEFLGDMMQIVSSALGGKAGGLGDHLEELDSLMRGS